MGKKKPQDGPIRKPTADRHKGRRMVGLPEGLYRLLAVLAARNHRPLSWELRLAVSEHLDKAGLSPPGEGEAQPQAPG